MISGLERVMMMMMMQKKMMIKKKNEDEDGEKEVMLERNEGQEAGSTREGQLADPCVAREHISRCPHHYLTERVHKVVLRKSIPAQIRQLILHY